MNKNQKRIRNVVKNARNLGQTSVSIDVPRADYPHKTDGRLGTNWSVTRTLDTSHVKKTA